MRQDQRRDYLEFARYFVPLAIQAASQSLTYPLVAMVASRGPGGAVNLAGLAQSNSVMFLISTLGAGLMTTGMVYARTRENFRQFCRVNYTIAFIVTALQMVLCLPPLSHLLFGTIIGLPVSIEAPARTAFLFTIPLQFIFFLRQPYQVVLYNNRATGRASGATLFRIGLTALLSPVFCAFGLVGVAWAAVALTLPVIIETIISQVMARPYMRDLPVTGTEPISAPALFKFNLPLSLGGLFLSMSGMIMGAFIARAADPERMMPAFYLAVGLANPISFGLSRLQAVSICFPPEHKRDYRTLKFALFSGAIGGFLPLLFIIPGFAELYYVKLQNLNPGDLRLVRQTALIMYFVPLCAALRAQIDGVAAWMKKPVNILTGQAVYLGCMVTAAFVTLAVGVPGNLMGPCCIIFAALCASSMVRVSLKWEGEAAPAMTEAKIPQDEGIDR